VDRTGSGFYPMASFGTGGDEPHGYGTTETVTVVADTPFMSRLATSFRRRWSPVCDGVIHSVYYCHQLIDYDTSSDMTDGAVKRIIVFRRVSPVCDGTQHWAFVTCSLLKQKHAAMWVSVFVDKIWKAKTGSEVIILLKSLYECWMYL
jgi:hypothetical protein